MIVLTVTASCSVLPLGVDLCTVLEGSYLGQESVQLGDHRVNVGVNVLVIIIIIIPPPPVASFLVLLHQIDLAR